MYKLFAVLILSALGAYPQSTFLPYGTEMKQGATSAVLFPAGLVDPPPGVSIPGIPPPELRMASVFLTLNTGDPLVTEFQITATVKTIDGSYHQFNELVEWTPVVAGGLPGPSPSQIIQLYTGHSLPLGVVALKVIGVHADQVKVFAPDAQ